MQNARSMPATSCGQGIVYAPSLGTSWYSSSKATRRVSFPPRHLQCSSVTHCGGKAFSREPPVEWNRSLSSVRPLAITGGAGDEKQAYEEELEFADSIDKPQLCTADELHYVAVPRTAWRLALWRYLPSKAVSAEEGASRAYALWYWHKCNGVDLDSSASLARHLSAAGFDTWILEVRGTGLSKREGEPTSSGFGGTDGALSGSVQEAFVQATIKNATKVTENKDKDAAEYEIKETSLELQSNPVTKLDEPATVEEDTVASRMTNRITYMSQTLRSLVSEGQTNVLISKLKEQITALLEDMVLNERFGELWEKLTGLLEGPHTNSVASQVTEFSKRVALLLEEGQRSVTPSVTNLQERLTTTINDFHEVLELIAKYDWDFDTYLEEDVPAAMDYVITHSATSGGKILGVGHSMGGILLYAVLAIREERAGLAGAVALASSLDYAVSDSSLKMLLPLTDPAQMLSMPVIPLGALMNAIHPLSSRPPYALAYLGYQVSAREMMEPDLFKKLLCNNFCTVPVKLLLQLATVFKPGGLQNRNGTVMYKDRLHSCKVPVLAIAGDEDLICPPIAVTETVKAFPQSNVTYKAFGGGDERHYGHYDLLCARIAKQEVYPVILDFLIKCDSAKVDSSA